LFLAVSFLVGAAPDPAHADDVRSAEARVRQLQGLVQRTTAALLQGTREWQHDQAELKQVRAKLAGVTRQVQQQEAVADAGRARVAVLARRMYMSPVNDQLRMVVTMDADQVIGLIRTQGELRQIAQGDTEVVHEAELARLRLDRARASVAALADRATKLAQQSKQRQLRLNALAMSTLRQLDAAQRDLARARSREAARLARIAAARASRLRAMLSRGGGGCLTTGTAGMSNGNLDPSVLCPLWHAPGHRLRTDAARAFNRMSVYHWRTLRTPLCVTDSYRSYAAQVDVYQRKPDLAAVPGTSNHGWGRAVDMCGGVQTAGTAAYDWMKRFGPRFGFHHPAWAEPHGSKPEAWHWEYGTS
jgi:hypothetical protein